MAIQKEIWAADIAANLFPSDAWINQAVNDDIWVDGKKVHRANSGVAPEVVKNRTSLPAIAVQRVDTDSEYSLDEFTSTPTVIQDIEEIEVNYAKRTSVLSDHSNELNKQIANNMAFRWAPSAAAAILRTTGNARVANVVGATGNRKMLLIEDILRAKALMDDMDVPSTGRNILLPAHMYNDLLQVQWANLLSLDKAGKAKLDSGEVLAIFGFNIYTRGKKNILSYTNATIPVVRDPGAAALTTANAAALIWHPSFVSRAKGAVKVYAKEDEPGYYGSIFSGMVRAGGQKIYSDGTGVIAIVEDATT